MTSSDTTPASGEAPRGKLVVVGQGYVGLPLAMRAVEVGWDVVGVEPDAARAARLRSGDSYVEDIPSEQLAAALATGRYQPSAGYDSCAGFDVAVITVPTPLREGIPDLSYIEESSRSLADHLTPGATVILESTTYPGTTEELVAPLLEEGSGLEAGVDFHLGYSPERIDPGNADLDLREHPEGRLRHRRGRRWPRCRASTTPSWTPPCRCRSPKEAELTKLLENTFRHVNIALVNELAMFAHDLGIDVWEAIDAASTKPFGFMRFTPGPGVGGHCLPIDPSYLSWQVKQSLGQAFRFVELANDVNDHMPDYVVQRLSASLNARAQADQRVPDPAARAGLQEEHRRRPRVPRPAGRRPARRDGRRGAGGRPVRRRARPPGTTQVELTRTSSRRRTWSSCSPTTTRSTSTSSRRTPRTCSTAAASPRSVPPSDSDRERHRWLPHRPRGNDADAAAW